NLATLSRSPTVWGDEVMFSEAAVRYWAGHGFTVTSWPAAPGTLGVLNGPLHTLLLVPWMGLWGVSATASRSLGLALVGLSAVVLWGLVRRRGWVRSAGLRLAGVGVMLCGHGVAAAARSGRYDGLGMLMVATAVALAARPDAAGRDWRRDAGLALLGVAVPWAGVYLLPYGALLAGVATLLGGRAGWRRVAPGVAGVALGIPAWVLAHHLMGTLSAVAAFTVGQAGQPLSARLAGLPAGLARDVSVVPLLAVLMATMACGLAGGRRAAGGGGGRHEPSGALPGAVGAQEVHGRRRGPTCPAGDLAVAAAGLLAGLGVPVWMTLAGKYTLFYAWMAYVPALGAALVLLDRLTGVGAARRRRVGGLAILAALALAALVGLPLRLAACALEWDQRDHRAMERLVEAHLASSDVVVSGPEAYYASARRCRETLAVVAPVSWPGGIPSRVTALVGGAGLGGCLGDMGPEWTAVARYAPAPYRWPWRLGRTRWYDVTVWRRSAGGERGARSGEE
ncbi:MAG: hypothetical protein GX595_11650, partial [Lentisphaerae bacterium]|nr:hypothetical protein [Lentisphaerota bacterium]